MNFVKLASGLILFTVALSSQAQDKSMSEQAAEDWQAIKQTAGVVADKTVETGKAVGKKATEVGKVVGKKAAEVGKAVGSKAVEVGQAARDKAVELSDGASAKMQEDERKRLEAERNEPAREKPAQRFIY